MPTPSHSIVRVIPRASVTGAKARRTPLSRVLRGWTGVSVGARDRHQYRILGSMYALTKSMTRLATTTTSANTTMIPWTAA